MSREGLLFGVITLTGLGLGCSSLMVAVTSRRFFQFAFSFAALSLVTWSIASWYGLVAREAEPSLTSGAGILGGLLVLVAQVLFSRGLRINMQRPTTKAVGALLLAGGVFWGFIERYPFVFSLCWPSLALARAGVPHSWVLSAALILGGVAMLRFWARKRPWWAIVPGAMGLPWAYCAMAFWFAARWPVPLPEVTPYDAEPALRASYLESYRDGYRNGQLGKNWTYCFMPEAETRGSYDGAYQGILVWHRMLGLTMSEDAKRHFRSSAAIDGVGGYPR